MNEDGIFPRKSDAGYGPDARNRDVQEFEFEPVRVTEHYVRWDENGWTKSETTIRADGKIVVSRGS